MTTSAAPKSTLSFDPIVFGVSATLTILFVLWSALFRESMETAVGALWHLQRTE